MNIYAQRIESVRNIMREKGIDAVVLTGSDPHCSEYPASRWKQVEWICGFTGEAGDIVITMDHAGLWTDTRYFIQAVEQLEGTGVELHKTRVLGEVRIPEWLADVAFADKCGTVAVAVDGVSQTVSSVEEIENAFIHSGRHNASLEDDKNGYRIIDCPDILDGLWKDRPAVPCTPIITLGEDLTGESRASKLAHIREFIAQKNCDCILFTALDEIAWILNVRGSDVEYNPVVQSYLLVSENSVVWFVRKSQTTDAETADSFAELSAEGIEIKNYDDIRWHFSYLGPCEVRIYVDPSKLNYHLQLCLTMCNTELKDQVELVKGPSPVSLSKAVKNETEIEGMREAHFEDGVAMEKFLYWIDRCIKDGVEISEWDASRKLTSLRAEIQGYRGDSFQTISAYGASAALPHYVTPEIGSKVLEPHGLYLCDSGGQYLFGTTDITRTVALGPCTADEMEDYTLVLKGHIGLASAVFPLGTSGCHIDYAARCPLWQFKRNFGHGTGHGIGFFLNVHEGPQDIRQNYNRQQMLPGMITSDEPGFYKEGDYGIRHESLLLCVKVDENEFGTWLGFENLTLCHIDTRPIVRHLLTDEEVAWLNAYNERVYETVSPRLSAVEADWLRERTMPI